MVAPAKSVSSWRRCSSNSSGPGPSRSSPSASTCRWDKGSRSGRSTPGWAAPAASSRRARRRATAASGAEGHYGASGVVRAHQGVREGRRGPAERHPPRAGATGARAGRRRRRTASRSCSAQLVLIAMGFLHPEHAVLDDLGVEKDERGNCRSIAGYRTSREGVFTAGDMRRGQSLVVWAIAEGRECAREVDAHLSGRPSLLAARAQSRSDVALA